MPPEFVQPQDGKDKQDGELAASARWLARWGEHDRPWRITYLGDDRYCHQSHCLRVRAQQADFLFTCKPESHATLYEWVGDFERNEQLGRVVQARRVGKKHFTDTYRDAHQVPLRNTDDAVMANWLERLAIDAALDDVQRVIGEENAGTTGNRYRLISENKMSLTPFFIQSAESSN